MIGWLVDTNVIASLAAPEGAPSVKNWARVVDERQLFLSVLTLAEYDKGIANLPEGDPNRHRFGAIRDAIEFRFSGRILLLSDAVVRRWGAISGRVKRDTGRPPPVVDTLMAASAIEADLYLVSRNTRDLKHGGAKLSDPWKDDIEASPLSPLRPQR